MKKTFLFMSLLLGFVVSGMLVSSCDDDDEGGSGGNSELVKKLKGVWEMAGDADDWYPFWEITDKNVYLYSTYDEMESHNHKNNESYTYSVRSNSIIRLADVNDKDDWYDVKVVSVTSDKLVVYWDYEDGDYDEKLTFYKVK